MKCFVSILLLLSLHGLCGCASIFRDPLHSAYTNGEISKEEYERLSRQKEEELARTSPAFWEREQTASQVRYDLNP